MNQERISAFVDGESAHDEINEVIDTLTRDPEFQGIWSRYHLIGEVLRADGLSIHAASGSPVEDDAANVVPLPAKRNLLAPIAGLAIAASVAALAVTIALHPAQQSEQPEFQVAASVTPQTLAPAPIHSIKSTTGSVVVPVGEYDQRLNGYLVNFNEQRARLGVRGVHPYVRIVGFEAE
jgi:sigma-E factor negative regulatory protein RseA